jgi:hypothetical protein
MKICFRCKAEKNLDDFHNQSSSKDGKQRMCKPCRKEWFALHRPKNLEKFRAYSKEFRERTGVIGKRQAASKMKEYRRRLTTEETHKMNVRSYTAKLVKSGKLKRMPCERCGSQSAEAHHESYQNPMEVMWLCKLHHAARHREIRNVQTKSA